MTGWVVCARGHDTSIFGKPIHTYASALIQDGRVKRIFTGSQSKTCRDPRLVYTPVDSLPDVEPAVGEPELAF